MWAPARGTSRDTPCVAAPPRAQDHGVPEVGVPVLPRAPPATICVFSLGQSTALRGTASCVFTSSLRGSFCGCTLLLEHPAGTCWMQREFSDGLVCQPQTPGHVIAPAPPAGTSAGQTQGQAPHLNERGEEPFLNETGWSGGPWAPGVPCLGGGRDCKIERWGDSGILLGTGAGDSDAEATSPPEGVWTGVSGAGNGPRPVGRPSVMSSQV